MCVHGLYGSSTDNAKRVHRTNELDTMHANERAKQKPMGDQNPMARKRERESVAT